MIVLGYDPGDQGALAYLRAASPRPILLASEALTRPRAKTAEARRVEHLDAVYEVLERFVAAHGPPDLVVVEIPARGGRSRGGVRALALAQVLGDARGLGQYARGRWPGCRVLEVESGVWCEELGIPTAKQPTLRIVDAPDGLHRLGELRLWTAPAEGAVLPAYAFGGSSMTVGNRLIARAEAALIGVAGMRIAART